MSRMERGEWAVLRTKVSVLSFADSLSTPSEQQQCTEGGREWGGGGSGGKILGAVGE